MPRAVRDMCRGSGTRLRLWNVRNQMTRQVERVYDCGVCGAYLQPKRDGTARRHVDMDARHARQAREGRPMSHILARWLAEAAARVQSARRSGDPSAVRAAEAALKELQQAVRQIERQEIRTGVPVRKD